MATDCHIDTLNRSEDTHFHIAQVLVIFGHVVILVKYLVAECSSEPALWTNIVYYMATSRSIDVDIDSLK